MSYFLVHSSCKPANGFNERKEDVGKLGIKVSITFMRQTTLSLTKGAGLSVASSLVQACPLELIGLQGASQI